MSEERLKPRAITLMRQSSEMGCGPTSVAMALSGFGIITTEQLLAERYFPGALQPFIDPASGRINYSAGVNNQLLIEGMVQILKDQGLSMELRVGVFDAYLWRHTTSPEERYIVKTTPRVIRECGDRFNEDDRSSKQIREFYQTLERMVKRHEIGVYTANARKMHIGESTFRLDQEVERGFYDELADFVRKGHIVGPHGGMTAHLRVLDGTRTEKIRWDRNQEGFVMLDPRGETHAVRVRDLVRVDNLGVRGDLFDLLFRISPREEVLNPHHYSFRSFILHLRKLLSKWVGTEGFEPPTSSM